MQDTAFNMTGYTKLFGSIVDSTIWRESKETKIVWITMLAKANRDGIVEASLPGLADAARVTIEECESSLKGLSSPDKYSRTKDFEGRRIEEVDGGWRVLNHAKYRAKMNSDERREYFRLKKQEYRKSPNSVHKSPILSTRSTQSKAKAQSEAEAFNTFWSSYPRKVGKLDALKAWSKIDGAGGLLPKMLTTLETQKKSHDWTKDDGQFVPYPATWLNRGRWMDEATSITPPRNPDLWPTDRRFSLDQAPAAGTAPALMDNFNKWRTKRLAEKATEK